MRPHATDPLKSSDIQDWIACHVTNILSFVDTIELFLRYLPRGVRKAIEALHGRPLRIAPCKDRKGNLVGYRLTVHQPSIRVLQLLDRLQEHHRVVLCRADITVDWITRTRADACQLRRALLRFTMLRWRRKGEMLDVGDLSDEETTYWVHQKARKRRSPRDLALYAHKPSKLYGEPCAHLELKFQNAKACRQEGFRRVTDLVGLDPHKLFSKHLRLSDGYERYVTHMIRRQIKADRLRHLEKRQRYETPAAMRQDRARAYLPR